MASTWNIAQIPSQHGKRYLITGANSGIGYPAAVELARHGATVLMACRDRARGEAALEKLQAEATGPESAAAQAELVILDLASLESVRTIAEAQLAAGKPLHGLINNAGVMAPPKRLETVDGNELQFGTNVLGHFALSCRLMPALRQGAEAGEASRVVTVASIAHKRGKMRYDDLNAQRSYEPKQQYSDSKLADLMFSFELERRLRGKSPAVLSVAAHPGVAQTNIFMAGKPGSFEHTARTQVGKLIGALLNTDADGALPTLYAATAPDAKGGGYYGPQGWMEARGGDVGPSAIARQAQDPAEWKRLWEACEAMTGVSLSE